MPLDLQFVFCKPRRHTIVGTCPLKDRIGSQILTHFETVQIARTITEQEAKLDAIQAMVHVPSL
jgi:magnesium chelatase subunit I